MKAFAPLTDRDSPTGIPTDSAQEIVVSLKSRGQLSLRALIKFSDAPLVELDASNCAPPSLHEARSGTATLLTLIIISSSSIPPTIDQNRASLEFIHRGRAAITIFLTKHRDLLTMFRTG